MDKVMRAKDKGAQLSKEQYQKYGKEAYNETVLYFYPNAGASMTEETANAVASKTNGVTPVHVAKTDTKTNSNLSPVKPAMGTKKKINGVWYTAAEEGWKRDK
jgi:hypothetical protein